MMILATVALDNQGCSQFSGPYILPEPASALPWFIYVFYGNLLLIALMLAWDWWRGRLVRSFVMASAALVAALYLASLMYFWEPWKALTLREACRWQLIGIVFGVAVVTGDVQSDGETYFLVRDNRWNSDCGAQMERIPIPSP